LSPVPYSFPRKCLLFSLLFCIALSFLFLILHLDPSFRFLFLIVSYLHLFPLHLVSLTLFLSFPVPHVMYFHLLIFSLSEVLLLTVSVLQCPIYYDAHRYSLYLRFCTYQSCNFPNMLLLISFSVSQVLYLSVPYMLITVLLCPRLFYLPVLPYQILLISSVLCHRFYYSSALQCPT